MKMLSKGNGYFFAAILATSFFYFNGADVTTSVYATGTVFALPLALAAMVGIMCERTGIVNIGIEGTMLLSAFVAFFVASLTQNIIIGHLSLHNSSNLRRFTASLTIHNTCKLLGFHERS